MKKFCVKCGKQFEATGREVICPSCKEHAAEDAKRAAVLKAKRASWTGESVPVRISGRASTVIRRYGAANNLPFAAALDALLKSSDFFGNMGKAWEEVEPYKSHRRDKHATETENTSTTETAQDVPQDAQTAQEVKQVVQDTASKPQDVQAAGKPQEVKQAARKASKATTSKATNKAAGKTVKTSKATSKKE